MRTVAELAVESIRAAGVDTLFCLPGVQNDDFFDALVDAPDIRPVVTRHEQGASYMAMGASQVTGRPAACCVVPGPGMLNAAAGLTSAYWAGGRVLTIVGAVPNELRGLHTGVLHDLPDQTAVLDQLTKHSTYIESGDDAAASIQRAVDAVASGVPRPVAVEVPVDVWSQPADGAVTLPQSAVQEPDGDAIEKAAAAIAGAERPLIVVGGGAHEASTEVVALAEALEAPVFTRRQGHGVVDSRHRLWVPLTVGRTLWADADVVIGIGTRLEFPLMHWGTTGLTVVQVNIDADELDRHQLGTIGVESDAKTGVAALLAALADHRPSRPDLTEHLDDLRGDFARATARLEPQRGMLDAIRDVLPDRGVVVEDVTQLGFAAHLLFEFRHPRTFLTTGPAGTLGAGVAHAIGAQTATDEPVLALVGDGGFLFSANELATAMQHDIPVTILLSDNGAYGNVKRIQTERFGADRTIASTLQNPDFEMFGRSFGVHTQRADDAETLRGSLDEAFAHDGPSLIVSKTGDVPNPWPFLRMGPVR